MAHQEEQSSGPDKRPVIKKKQGEQETKEGFEDSCRCKEVSKKTFPELLSLMISDLAFWKKKK